MRVPHRFLALATLAALGACHKPAPALPAASTPIAVAAGPQQAAGLWAQKVSDRRGVSVTRYCLDASAGSALASFDRNLGNHCSRHDMAQAADGSWHFSTSCDMGAAGKVATEGVMRGDFQTHYTVEAHSQTVAATDAAANGPGRVMADVSRVGDCPSDMKPGDVVLPDGSRSRLETLASHA
ncbi:MAG TPA: DUF3617 family protein [Caulobacteraceae bacterium]|jgi:hypothetical protein